jgi:hypothetical protein
VLLPTPMAINERKYRDLYSFVLGSDLFCTTAFGPHFPARETNDDEIREWLVAEIAKTWNVLPLGNFAVGTWNIEAHEALERGRKVKHDTDGIEICILEGQDAMIASGDNVDWVGYVGVRDGTLNMKAREEGDEPFPPWQVSLKIANRTGRSRMFC